MTLTPGTSAVVPHSIPPITGPIRSRSSQFPTAFRSGALLLGFALLQLPVLYWPQWLILEAVGLAFIALFVFMPSDAHRAGLALAVSMAGAQTGLAEGGGAVGMLKFGPLVVSTLALAVLTRRPRPLAPGFRRAAVGIGCFLFWAIALAWVSNDALTVVLRSISLGVMFALTFWLIPRALEGPSAWRTLLVWSAITLLPGALSTALMPSTASRASGFFNNPNAAAWPAATLGAVAISALADGGRTPARLAWLAVVVLSGSAVLATGSRSGTGILAGTVAVGLAASSVRLARHGHGARLAERLLLLALLAVVAAVAGELMPDPAQTRALDFGRGLAGREEIWSQVLTESATSLAAGKGFGLGSHSSYIAILYGSGVVGATLFAWFLAVVLWALARVVVADASDHAVYVVGLCLAVLVGRAFEGGLTSPAQAVTLLTWTAMGVCVSRPDVLRTSPPAVTQSGRNERTRGGGYR